MELVIFAVMGIVFIVIGIINMRGNIDTLHSYHRHRVAKEDVKPMGKLIGIGMFIIGGTMLPAGVLFMLDGLLSVPALSLAGSVVLVIGLVVGVGLNLYAIFKYNKGLF